MYFQTKRRRKFLEGIALGLLPLSLWLSQPSVQPKHTENFDLENNPKPEVDLDRSTELVELAKSWVGKQFNPNQRAQCAFFVRYVLKQANLNIGITKQPIDNLQAGPGHANSFFGPDLGTLVFNKKDLKPGNLVAWQNTYGSYPPGTITHVGIYIGEGRVVDRPTSIAPVRVISIDKYQFRVGLAFTKNLTRAS